MNDILDAQAVVLILAWYFVAWVCWSYWPVEGGWNVPNREQYICDIRSLPDECPAADLALSEAKDYFTNFRDSARNLDLRATGILGFVGGGTGIWAAAGGTEMLQTTLLPVLLYAAVALLFTATTSSVLALMARTRGSPNVPEVLDVSALRNSNRKSVMTATLAWEFIDATRQMHHTILVKRACVNVAQAAFMAGVFLLVISTLAQTRPIPTGCKPSGFGNIHNSVNGCNEPK